MKIEKNHAVKNKFAAQWNGILAALFGMLAIGNAHAYPGPVYVTVADPGTPFFEVNNGSNSIGEYDSYPGGTINSSLETGLPSSPSYAVLSGGNLYVENAEAQGSITEFTVNSGSVTATDTLITGLYNPNGIAISGNTLYVVSNVDNGPSPDDTASIVAYNATTGASMGNVVTGLGRDYNYGLAISGNNIYVSNNLSGTINEYSLSTGQQNLTFAVTGLSQPSQMVISGNDLFVTDISSDTVGEYDATTGAAIHSALVTGLNNPDGIALVGGDLLVTNIGDGTSGTGSVGEYDATTGIAVNASLVTGLDAPYGIVATPEPSTWVLILAGLGASVMASRQLRRKEAVALVAGGLAISSPADPGSR